MYRSLVPDGEMLKVKQFSMFVLNSLFAASFANAAANKVTTADELYQQALSPMNKGGYRAGPDVASS